MRNIQFEDRKTKEIVLVYALLVYALAQRVQIGGVGDCPYRNEVNNLECERRYCFRCEC